MSIDWLNVNGCNSPNPNLMNLSHNWRLKITLFMWLMSSRRRELWTDHVHDLRCFCIHIVGPVWVETKKKMINWKFFIFGKAFKSRRCWISDWLEINNFDISTKAGFFTMKKKDFVLREHFIFMRLEILLFSSSRKVLLDFTFTTLMSSRLPHTRSPKSIFT